MYMPQPQPDAKSAMSDPKIKSSIYAVIDSALAEEEKAFTPGLESFTVHANKLRESLHGAMVDLHQRLQRGYDAIGSWLDEQGIARPSVRPEAIASMEDEEQFLGRVSGDEPLFQTLGFSEDDMTNFYRAAYAITCGSDYEKGRDAFFFLVTLAPGVSSYWLGLAINNTCLMDNVPALAATLRVISLAPSNIDCYLNAIYLYLQAHDTMSAEALCTKGSIMALPTPMSLEEVEIPNGGLMNGTTK